MFQSDHGLARDDRALSGPGPRRFLNTAVPVERSRATPNAATARPIRVLADGTVESAGTHEELLAERGRYAELFELQAAGYR